MRAQQEPIPVSLFNNVLLAVALVLALLAPAPAALAVGDPVACTAFPVITVGNATVGTLDAVGDCFQAPPNRLIDTYSLTLTEAATLSLDVTSEVFGAVVGIRHPNVSPTVPGQFIAQRGRQTAGAVAANVVLPAGSYVVYVSSFVTNPTTPPTGAYTLTLNVQAQPQAACVNGQLNGTGIVKGSVAAGAISAQDCELGPREDLVAGEVPRHVDAYALFAPANIYHQVTVAADFDYRIEHWEGVGANPPVL